LNASAQRLLSDQQTSEFYHDEFVSDQVAAYLQALGASLPATRVTVDVGGGCGFFARALRDKAGIATRVLDRDPQAIAACTAAGVEAFLGDALRPTVRGDEEVACFNMVLHHLVGSNEVQTRELQIAALRAWQTQVRHLFVNEYVYESFGSPGLSGKLIWSVTSNRALSSLARQASKLAPSLRANTLGVGVRFRAATEWLRIFGAAGYELVTHVKGTEELIGLPRRLLLIRSSRRDSFVLRPRA
jgi:hypothetical protein